jgi:hypothetical protein
MEEEEKPNGSLGVWLAGAVDDVSPHIIAPLLINKSVWQGEEIRQILQRPE